MRMTAAAEKIGAECEEVVEPAADCVARQITQSSPSPGNPCSTEAFPCCQECKTSIPHEWAASAVPTRMNIGRHTQSTSLRARLKRPKFALVCTVCRADP